LRNQSFSDVFAVTGLLTMGISHSALVLHILIIIQRKLRIIPCLKRKCQYFLSMICWNLPDEDNNYPYGQNRIDVDSLPDRLVNPNEYEPLVPAVKLQHDNSHSES